ncbi:NTP transferase domain-containing protein [Candidatus Saccharibacteria bacterium]|nr:NTP transferase domain-containing protein [Candidatus Saccharibacteria bacterium]MBQ6147685.1 NTP transferase domain-containing protein [Candidatus Saccharibacteria bacterium]
MNYKKPTKAIITDAGFASRYLPITKTIPKAMMPIGNRPVMQLVVEECVKAGITQIIIVATPEGKPIYEDYFNNACNHIRKQLASQGKQDRYESIEKVLDFPKITVIVQDPSFPYGNGSPIASARPYIRDDEAFVAIYSDDVVFGKSAVSDLLDAFEEHPDAAAIIAGQPVPHEEIKKYASISLDGDKVTGLIEKPDPKDAPSDLASYGRYLLTPEIFGFLNPANTGLDNELWTADAIARLIPTGRVYAKKTSGTWMTTGDPKNYFLAHLKHVLDSEDYADDVKKFIKEAK